MATDRPDNKFLIGVLVGAGVGLVAALLLAPNRGARNRRILLERARDVADRVSTVGRGRDRWRERKAERAGRTLKARIERIRSAGY